MDFLGAAALGVIGRMVEVILVGGTTGDGCFGFSAFLPMNNLFTAFIALAARGCRRLRW